jgi:predicted transcriptional regulator
MKLLEQVVERLRQLPEDMQDKAARALLLQIEEEPEPGDLEAIAEGQRDFERGDFVTLEQLRRELTE